MKLVIDASVTLKWLLAEEPDEQDVDRALAVLNGIETDRYRMLQPPHWKAETIGVMARRIPASIDRTLHFLERLPAVTIETTTIYRRAADIAVRSKQHLFDTLYHAVALEMGATYITADERYYGAVSPDGSIRRLIDFRTA